MRKATTFSIFGIQNSGKTTLAGYLMYGVLPHEQLQEMFSSEKKKMNNYKPPKEYVVSDRWCYLARELMSDRGRRDSKHGHSGNTTKLIFSGYEVGFGEYYNFIDGPGIEHTNKKLLHNTALTFSDMCLFLIEAKDIEERLDVLSDVLKKDRKKYLKSKSIKKYDNTKKWLDSIIKANQEMKKVIIVISKSDLVNENDLFELYELMTFFFKHDVKINLEIVPISVNVKTEETFDANINTKYYDFYNGKTIKELLRLYSTDMSANSVNTTAFFLVDKVFPKMSNIPNSPFWRGKAMTGNFSEGEKVFILPRQYKDEFVCVSGIIKSIHNIDKRIVSFLAKDEIGSYGISSFKIKKKSIDIGKLDIHTSKLPIYIVSSNARVMFGECVFFHIDTCELEYFKTYAVTYLGRTYNALYILSNNNEKLLVLDRPIFVPIDDNGILLKNISIEKPNGDIFYGSIKKVFKFNEILQNEYTNYVRTLKVKKQVINPHDNFSERFLEATE